MAQWLQYIQDVIISVTSACACAISTELRNFVVK